MNNFENKILHVWTARIPFSLDPLDYDALAHHICFRSVYSSLVSDYSLGKITGVIADSWSSSDDKKKWRFSIRKGMTFANGQLISPLEVALSLNRAALRMKISNSNSGLLEYLEEFDQIKTADALIKGISIHGESIELSFKASIPDVLTKISFGLYAIASSSDYDNKTGEWKDKKSINSSGPYSVDSWSESKLKLKLKRNFELIENPIKMIKDIEFNFDSKSIAQSDLIVDFDDSIAIPENYKFYGPIKSAIRYIECTSWKDPNSICYNKNNRLMLRNSFYEELSKLGIKTTKSFLPLAINGITEFNEDQQIPKLPLAFKSQKISISMISKEYKSIANANKLTFLEAFEIGVNKIAMQNNVQLIKMQPNVNPQTISDVDLKFRMTAVLVDSPKHDLTFMVKSEHGIKLPDTDGSLNKIVENYDFTPDNFNKTLWEQGAIWPLGHMSLGIWIRQETLNLENYNLILPPLDLSWIEWK